LKLQIETSQEVFTEQNLIGQIPNSNIPGENSVRKPDPEKAIRKIEQDPEGRHK